MEGCCPYCEKNIVVAIRHYAKQAATLMFEMECPCCKKPIAVEVEVLDADYHCEPKETARG